MARRMSLRKLTIVGVTTALAVAYWGATSTTIAAARPTVTHTFATSKKSDEAKSTSLANLISQYNRANAPSSMSAKAATGSPGRLSIQAPKTISAIEGAQFSQQLSATGASGSIQWSMTSNLPWLQLSSNGVLSGIPTSPGNGQVTITASDAAGNSTQTTLSVQVDVPSSNWSGYVDYSPNGVPFTSASAQFIVPTISASLPQSCSADVSGGLSLSCSLAEWVGIGGTSGNGTLIQAGVYEIPNLTTGQVEVVPWVENLPSPSQVVPNMNVAPGNDIQVTVQQVAGTEWQVTVHDVTTGQSVSGTGNYYGSGNSADFIVEAPTTAAGQTQPLGFTSPVKFFDVQTSSTVANDGQTMVPTAMVQSGGVATYPGSFHTSDNGFQVYYDEQQGS